MNKRPSTPRGTHRRGFSRHENSSASAVGNKNRRQQRGHRRSRSLSHAANLFTPSSLAGISSTPFDLDLLVEKSKTKLCAHERDFDALIHATEQLVMAQRLKDLGHKVMIETLRTLRCSSMIKKKGNELADLLHNMYLKEIERTEVFSNLLDVLENVKNTHRVTAAALRDEYDKMQKKFADFSEKHPDVTFSLSPVSSCSTDDELAMSDSSDFNFGSVIIEDSVLGNSSNSPSLSSSFFSFLRSSSHSDKLLQHGEELKESLETRRNDFVNSVNILEKKGSDLVVCELNDLCNLYRDVEMTYEEPDPLQPL